MSAGRAAGARTAQEDFWAGEFGDAYVERNQGARWVAANAALFARVLARAPGVGSILELGANIGLNLEALRTLLPSADLAGVEINEKAHGALSALGYVDAKLGSAFEVTFDRTYDLVFTKGVMIHINPDKLPELYAKMAALSARYVLIAEYYNPTPMSIPYRGESDKLFKRDFAGEFLDAHPAFELLDYGFVWRRDPHFPQDDCTWFLMRKNTPPSA